MTEIDYKGIGNIPMLCYSKDAEYYVCNDLNNNHIKNIFKKLKKLESIKPDILNFLVDNKVLIAIMPKKVLYDAIGLKKRLETQKLEIDGLTLCDRMPKAIILKENVELPIILHEYAHCKEDIMRGKGGLPHISGSQWEIGKGKITPFGFEARAEHFRERMEHKLDGCK